MSLPERTFQHQPQGPPMNRSPDTLISASGASLDFVPSQLCPERSLAIGTQVPIPTQVSASRLKGIPRPQPRLTTLAIMLTDSDQRILTRRRRKAKFKPLRTVPRLQLNVLRQLSSTIQPEPRPSQRCSTPCTGSCLTPFHSRTILLDEQSL